MGDGLNSSAQILPLCLAGEFASSANIALLYAVLQNAKLLEKTFFKNLIIFSKSFYGR